MSEDRFPTEKRRGMGPIRGYPSLMKKDNQDQQLYAVIGLAILGAPSTYEQMQDNELTDEVQDQKLQKIAAMVQTKLEIWGRIISLHRSQEIPAWRIDLSADSSLLDRSVGLTLNFHVLETISAEILEICHVYIQLIVSSVYPVSDDISLPMDELTTLEGHALLLNDTKPVCANNYGNSDNLAPEDSVLPRHEKMDLEKLFFNSIITLNFYDACNYFLEILEIECKIPETAVSLRPRVSNRLAWILYVLGTPPNHGNHNPIQHNLMAEIAALEPIRDMETFLEQVNHIFELLDEDYNQEQPKTKLKQITEYIETHYDNCNLDAACLCEQFGITPPSLSRMFRREMDTTMLDFVHNVRLGHVKQLLLETSAPLQKIAAACGYYSAWTMTRTFKKYEGITPGDYRKNF